ncbi:MAG TPA: chromosome segregation protein SMC [Candidatus Limnocylindrales bacterium]|nr:chromosome segregation protein SMC [Candidatus Limnocylindrales bacterium]
MSSGNGSGSPADLAAQARLLSLRLHGFKSFAERTVVEFGPGISAIVGPNGSGKSNLADALRWALGEQGRALRSRKSEDVIWAGSERRAAVGMADVTILLDNADGLLPVDYQVLELGRRLYRSGENDYLLNRQRVRLRDLVDLLDSAHLADNAFLFIGQGMVDQALALRPEERRPLFEEVAGVRRHERRRRKAEEQLTESESNLARVEDIVAELRPQARRLAAQAEQQATRLTAGEELATGLLLAAHARWFGASARAASAESRRAGAQAEADAAMAELQVAEEAASGLADELGARAVVERERRGAYETAQSALTTLRLREERVAAELEAIGRERGRLAEERAVVEADMVVQRRALAVPVAPRDVALEGELSAAERALADALAELATLRAASQARGEERAAVRRAAAVRQAELETARRRLADAERRAGEERALAAQSVERRAALEAAASVSRSALADAVAAEQQAAASRASARAAADAADGTSRAASERLAGASSRLAELRGRLEALQARQVEEETRGIARAARRVGGRRLDEDLVVDPGLRAAVEAALGDTARGYLVDAGAVIALASERGILVTEAPVKGGAPDRPVREHAIERGGGLLADAVRRDGHGAATTLLNRAVWLPDLAACLAFQAHLPAGWVAVPRNGSAVVTDRTVRLGAADGTLDRRAETDKLAGEVARLEQERTQIERAAAEAARAVDAARADVERLRVVEAEAVGARRKAEEAERQAARNHESHLRESGWHEAQAARLEAEVARARAALAELEGVAGTDAAVDADPADGAATAAWESRISELRARRDRLAGQVGAVDGERRESEGRHARAQAALAMDEERIGRAERDAATLAERERTLETEREGLRTELAAAVARENAARAAVDEVRTADAADRDRLAAAERAATTARERLRSADERLRAADHARLEATLALDGLREQLLVELASLGEPGLARLRELAPAPPAATIDVDANGDDEAAVLNTALDGVSGSWAAQAPDAEPPSPGRLATLRRRYHELGAANPFAVEEYAEVKARLEMLEGQAADLRAAIASTRNLINELNTMIADQFRRTFAALETAFAARFTQLFGGGQASLSLTDPSDLSATGVEIMARPPGKKAQALAMLSGGERALTAVALLFAMLEVRPVPFCVLDEVDAALDEANIGRFADAVRSLADRTQFIVITHNRGTIEAADALYGVTVGDDSVSRVISLRLDEAQALADRREELAPAG